MQSLENSLVDLHNLQHLNMLWTAKEAGKKALSHNHMPGFLDLLLTGLEPHMTGWILDFYVNPHKAKGLPNSVSVAAELYDGFGIAICLIEKTDA